MKTKTESKIRKHGEDLLNIFPKAKEQDTVELYKKLRRLEGEAERLAVNYCNGEINSDNYESRRDLLIKRVNNLLGNVHNRKPLVPVFLGDPRGYSLKIRDEYVREHNLSIHSDWGGYGIIAPDLT